MAQTQPLPRSKVSTTNTSNYAKLIEQDVELVEALKMTLREVLRSTLNQMTGNMTPTFRAVAAWHNALREAEPFLEPLGFRWEMSDNQGRYFRDGDLPLRIRFRKGKPIADSSAFRLSSKKGRTTLDGVAQNDAHFRYSTLLLSPFFSSSKQLPASQEEKTLNIWMIYDFNDTSYEAYVAVGVNLGAVDWTLESEGQKFLLERGSIHELYEPNVIEKPESVIVEPQIQMKAE